MTSEQHTKIYRALLSLKINSRVDLIQKDLTDYRRAKAEQELTETEEALKALEDAYVASCILRGEVPCPECGNFIAEAESVTV